jgi:hypothetical protein
MGESTSKTTQQSSTTPWDAAMPEINGLFGQLQGLIPNTGVNPTEQRAINQLTATGQAGNPFAPALSNVATTLLNGGGATSQNPALMDNLTGYKTGMSAYTDPNYSTVNSPAVRAALDQIGTDTTNSINSQFAAAGRSGSGMEAQTLGRGIAQAEAPLILAQANQDAATRQNALSSIYGAGNTTSGLITNNNQTGVANSQAGIPAASSALSAQNWGPQQVLQAQQLLQSIPGSNLGLLAQIGIPLAELGRNSNGTSTTQNDPSFLQDMYMATASLGNLMPKGPVNLSFGG